MTRKRHKWPEDKTERETYRTIRTCPGCGIRKITDHNGRLPFVYYLYPGSEERMAKLPECEAAA